MTDLTNYAGTQYNGPLVNGKAQGQGTYTFPDGIRYVGEFKDGEVITSLARPTYF
jgi:hypothetical protein